MPTVKEDIAQVRLAVRGVHPDVRLSNRYIYNKLMDVVKLLVRRETELRRIYNSTEVLKTIQCVQLNPVPTSTCTNILIPNCSTIARSVFKLPEAFQTPSGSIINVYSIDGSVRFISTTPHAYTSILKREFRGGELYYWIQDNYLYIPNSEISEVMVVGMFLNNSAINKLENKCDNFLNSESVIPQWLRMDAIRLVVESVAGVTKRIPEDENPNENSGN